jgi:hypothetical protein
LKNAIRSYTHSVHNAGRGEHWASVDVKTVLIGGAVVVDDVTMLFAASVDSPIVTIKWFVVSA